jgi:class 3 adenylate cyclase/tetratricopeptide (TPR) repeat protein
MDDDTGDSPTLASGLPGPRGLVAGRYQVRRRLGRGASKEVYLAYDERLDREVAVAIVVGAGGGDAAARARVAREAQVTGRLGDHPNVITVYDTGEHDGVPYLVLRAMGAGSLAEALARERPSIDDAIRLGGQIAGALAHAHAHGVVHRDVKPDNVWLGTDGVAALGDFGIAYVTGADRLTAAGVVVGTVLYLSPEQIRGDDEIGPASDLYALGVTLYELVAGQPPFTAKDPTQVLTQHLTVAPVPPSRHEPAVPPALERLILDLLAKEPADRPASAAAVVAELAAMRTRTAPPSAPAIRPDARRVVSVLAARADVRDPEALHGVLDRCAAVIEQHGGSAERYLGDALVGFFGLDESHEDDPLRAAKAAVELRAARAELRLGIESGEVFLGTGSRGATVATGAAISAAARLADAAAPGEILLGEAVRRALAAEARIDPASGALLELRREQPALLRTPQTPFVGRRSELDELHATLARTRDERVCRLVTVAGSPGIGKSRLAGEFLTALGDDITVLAGRCLAYGEGTTYRALADIVRGLGGDPRRRIDELLDGDEQAVRGVLSAIGLSDEPAHPEETAWALRRLLERLARDRPLVVAIEDIHWAAPALLDLLDHIVALSSGASILLLCLTRPELLEARPAWAAPQPNRSVLVLDALDEAQARELASLLGAGGPAARIAQRAEGNPLFVEQLVAVDAGHDEGELPASIQAVLSARIDRLEDDERTLLQRAAVEGRTFHVGALAALAPDAEPRSVGATLVALARKGLIGADRPEYGGEDAFRFTHALIREAAYSGIPKLVRADLHAGVAGWLEARPSAPDEIVGYHLEQACVLAAELGRSGERERALALRAVARLEAASRGALGRGDPAAASMLIARAVALLAPDAAARGALLPALGASLFEAGRMTEATKVLDDAIAQTSDVRIQARAQVEREFVRLETETGVGVGHALAIADAATPVLERERDDFGQCRAWSLRAQAAWTSGQVARADEAWREAAECARRAGDERALFDVYAWRATAAVLGPLAVDEAIGLCEGFRAHVAASPVAVAWMVDPLAALHAMKGEFAVAERLLEEGDETLRRLGHLDASVSHHAAFVRLLAGEPALAEVPLRAGIERLAPMSDGRLMATTTALLAQALHAQGRLDEAAEQCRLTAAAAAPDDIVSQVIWRGVRAKILAHEGRCAQAEAVAREAIALLEPTDLLSHHGDAMLDLAAVLRTCSGTDAWEGALREAIALHDLKGNVVTAERARSLLASWHGGRHDME